MREDCDMFKVDMLKVGRSCSRLERVSIHTDDKWTVEVQVGGKSIKKQCKVTTFQENGCQKIFAGTIGAKHVLT